jgi:hypothetical protein
MYLHYSILVLDLHQLEGSRPFCPNDPPDGEDWEAAER